MFLRPLHFQAAHRYWTDLSRRQPHWDIHYNWGVRSIELDPTGLENNRLIVRSLEARLRDGTPISIRATARCCPRSAAAFSGEQDARAAHLPGGAGSQRGSGNRRAREAPNVRYYQDTVEFEDENAGGTEQTVLVRAFERATARGQSGPDRLSSFADRRKSNAWIVPTAAYRKTLRIFHRFLSCDAWKPLNEGILGALFDRMAKKIDWLVGASRPARDYLRSPDARRRVDSQATAATLRGEQRLERAPFRRRASIR